MTVDVEGATIDISTYRQISTSFTRSYKEIAVPQCMNEFSASTRLQSTWVIPQLEGSVFIAIKAEIFLKVNL